jgi:hypothetical protein
MFGRCAVCPSRGERHLQKRVKQMPCTLPFAAKDAAKLRRHVM